MTIKIGLAGGYRVGKTYLGDYLTQFNFSHYAMADILKMTAVAANPKLAPIIYAQEKKPFARGHLVKVSEFWKARLGRDCFAQFVLAQTSAQQNVVVSDVRFREEAEALISDGYVLFWIGPDDSGYDLKTIRKWCVETLPAKPDLSTITPIINNYNV